MANTTVDFKNLCKIYITSCPDPIIEATVNGVIRDFCKQTYCFRKDTTITLVIGGAAEYAFANSTAANLEPIAIRMARIGDDHFLYETSEWELDHSVTDWRTKTSTQWPTHYFITDDNMFRNYPISIGYTDNITIDVIARPIVGIISFDDILYDNYGDIIQWGILAELYGMPDKAWSNPDQFQLASYKYRLGISETKLKLQKNSGLRSQYVRPINFGNIDYGVYQDNSWDV